MINTKINALVKFNDFLVETNVQPDIVLTKKLYENPTAIRFLSQNKSERLGQVLSARNTKDSQRNYAIITIMAYAGLRISEVLHLKMNNFNLASRKMVVKGKGDKTRTIFINDKVKTALQGWLKVRKESQNEYLFFSNRNRPLDRTTINKLFKDYEEGVGKEITLYDLRHFFRSTHLKMD
ncbi:tyrosine-type recombinase/integrase [Niallia endozanthoxylica]|uniref:tyrosine-type recombinase/integrase n=1 Tax=Niallia endozanthoxylica TaxID=2036016 RepID=UPI001CC4DC93|nr:tyrosine-type recombinase/integrase [Niallia endozanthoxylica]